MTTYTIALSAAEDKALKFVALSAQEWIDNAVHERCRLAIEEIVNTEVQRKLANNETISEKDIIADLALLNGKPVDVKFEKSSEAIQSVFNVSIYPNPSNGAFSVQATENAIVDVYDMNGKQITSSQVISSNGKVNIDLNNVEAGVYLVRVQNETFSTTKRIVIEK